MKKLVRFDWAVKKLLRSKANFVVLEGFLSELLKESIRIKNLLESEGNKEHVEDKFNRVDLLVENSRGELIIIEVQVEDQLDYLQRIVYGVSKIITEYIKESSAYKEVKKVISVNILYFDLGHGTDYVYHGKTNFKGIHDKSELFLTKKQTNEFTKSHVHELFSEYYLIKVNQFNDFAKDTLDEWIYFLKNEQIKDNFTAQGLKEAKDKLDVMKLPQPERKAYKAYVESLHDKASYELTVLYDYNQELKGIKEGIKEGMKEGLAEALKKMVESGIPESQAKAILGIK
jgi:predicted transposase/invertase (TIGR01784 family)